MRLVYLSVAVLPSRTANSIHVMCQCEAFAENGLDTSLYGRFGDPRVRRVHQAYGVEPIFSVHRRWMLPGLVGLYSRRVARAAVRLEPDVIYGRDLMSTELAARSGLPTVLETHEPFLHASQRPFLEQLAGRRNLRRVVVISEALKRSLLEHHGDLLREDLVDVVPDGVDLHRFHPHKDAREARAELGLDVDTFTVGYIGHLYPGRGAELILQVARAAPGRSFLIVGGNPSDAERLRALATDLPNVRIVGHVQRSQVPHYAACCDVLLMPYQERVAVAGGGGNTVEWMSPMKMFEYMAAGRPIVSSDLPVLREVLEHEHSALLVPPPSPDAWRQAIDALQQSPDLRADLAANARQTAEAHTWRVRADRVIEGIP